MDAKKHVQQAATATAWNPVRLLSSWGVKPGHAYTAGAISIVLSVASWALSKRKDGKPEADRLGLFIGEWAPTFVALGIALKSEEQA